MVDLTPKKFRDVCNANSSFDVGIVTLFLENGNDFISVAFANPEATLENRLMMVRDINLKRKVKILVQDGDHICLTEDHTPMLHPGTTITRKVTFYRVSVTPTQNGKNRKITRLNMVGTLPDGMRLTEIIPGQKNMMQRSFEKIAESIFGSDLVCNADTKMGGVPSVRFYKVTDEYKPRDVMLNPGANLTYGYRIDNGQLKFEILTLKNAELFMTYPEKSQYDGFAQYGLRSHNIWFWSFDNESELEEIVIKRLSNNQLMINVETENLSRITRKVIFASVYPDPNLIHIV